MMQVGDRRTEWQSAIWVIGVIKLDDAVFVNLVGIGSEPEDVRLIQAKSR